MKAFLPTKCKRRKNKSYFVGAKTEKTPIINMTKGYIFLIYEKVYQIKNHTNTCNTPKEKWSKVISR